jgi:phosphate butyryltransferase
MNHDDQVTKKLEQLRRTVTDSGYFHPDLFTADLSSPSGRPVEGSRIENLLRASRETGKELHEISSNLRRNVLAEVSVLDRRIREPRQFEELREFLERLLRATEGFRTEPELVAFYGELLSLYVLLLYRCGVPGRRNRIVELILRNIARRKAVELDQDRLDQAFRELDNKITIAVIAKRYAVYVLACRGLDVLFRTEIDFNTFGTSAEPLALQITNTMVRAGIPMTDVTDVVCGGGDLGTLPDGIYVLTEKIRDESWKKLQNTSLNRGALVAWELRELLEGQGVSPRINASLCSPLSFSTLRVHELGSLFRVESTELLQHLRGFVKVTPLKSTAAVLSEIQGINQANLNFLVMTLDELFASVVRKTGPKIVRELAAQEANATLRNFDFVKIVDCLKEEGFTVPPDFRLASPQPGTGVKEVCELLMIARSGKVSSSLSARLMHVVDSYASKVAAILEMACAGKVADRPHYIAITSMLALDPYFQQLYVKIRAMIHNPFTPVMCVDSLENEYLIANHLFELYVNPRGDRRLHFTVEAKSMKQALQVLGASSGGSGGIFTYTGLLDQVTGSIEEGTFERAKIVLVGADNEDALVAVANAKEQGLLGKVALIGDPRQIQEVIQQSKLSLSPDLDPEVELVPIDPLAVDYEAKKKSMAETFRNFLHENRDYVVMKGSIDTAGVLREALSIYKTDVPEGDGEEPAPRKLATSTALFVLPDGRFLALSDAAVNPAFRKADALVQAVENQVDVIRKILDNPDAVLKVAIITAVEKETAAIPATLLAGEAEEKAVALEELYGPLIVEGPLSFDVATVPGVAEEKHYQGKIAGDANCLVATDINTANVLYKMLSKTMGSLGLLVDDGAIITAGPGTVPIVLTSRGDTAKTKFNSILLALSYAMRSGGAAAKKG